MKVEYKYGIKSYSGKLDELVFSNYKSRDVVVARVYDPSQKVTENNHKMGQAMRNIAAIYKLTPESYKDQLSAYSVLMFDLEEFSGKIAGNKMTVFFKMMWAWANAYGGVDFLLSISTDDYSIGAYDDDLGTIATAVNNGFLPVVEGFSFFSASWSD